MILVRDLKLSNAQVEIPASRLKGDDNLPFFNIIRNLMLELNRSFTNRKY